MKQFNVYVRQIPRILSFTHSYWEDRIYALCEDGEIYVCKLTRRYKFIGPYTITGEWQKLEIIEHA